MSVPNGIVKTVLYREDGKQYITSYLSGKTPLCNEVKTTGRADALAKDHYFRLTGEVRT